MSTPDPLICPCDDHSLKAPVNPPGLDHIDYRIGGYREFRRSLLTGRDGETALKAWRPGGEGDLAVMMAEWWAYVADILTFYNERIANLSYLGTADRAEAVARLIRILGYRPRPAIGAKGVLAALTQPGQSLTLPKGLQFQNKPGPGQEVQTFELDADTAVGFPDAVPARPAEQLLAPETNVLLLQGEVRDVRPAERLLLRWGGFDAVVATVNTVTTQTLPDKTKQTRLEVTLSGAVPSDARAADFRLMRGAASQPIWTVLGSGLEPHPWWSLDSFVLHLSGLVRQIGVQEPLLLTAGTSMAMVNSVTSTEERVWYANGANSDPAQAPATNPLPIPHTVLHLDAGLDSNWRSNAAKIVVTYAFSEVGRLKDQPLATWDGASPLRAIAPAAFRAGDGLDALIEAADGAGVEVSLSFDGGVSIAGAGGASAPFTPAPTPLKALYNLLKVSRGKTVKDEVLGSGDARVPGQTFKLAKSPVTYLAKGPSFGSTVQVRVDGHPWSEVSSFYGQAPDAKVFVTSEDEAGKTWVSFGDGEFGARLPSGVNNIVATYRIGAGTASPPAGKLTLIGTPFPGLLAVRNPAAVTGGADPDPPEQIRRYAPRSVLAFGRAVSVMDYEALAAQAPGVTRVRAAWAWDETRQRAAVTLWVGDDEGARTSVRDALAVAVDRGAPSLILATPIETRLDLTLATVAGMDPDQISEAVRQALISDGALFSPAGLKIGQPVFDSAIVAAVMAVDGVTAVLDSAFRTGGQLTVDPGPLHKPGEGGWFDLTHDRIVLTLQPGGPGNG